MKYELHGIGEKAHTIHIEYIARSWLWATMAMQNGKKKRASRQRASWVCSSAPDK